VKKKAIKHGIARLIVFFVVLCTQPRGLKPPRYVATPAEAG
jgi:hypothetical protein